MTARHLTIDDFHRIEAWLRAASDAERAGFLEAFTVDDHRATEGVAHEILVAYRMALQRLDPEGWVEQWFRLRGLLIVVPEAGALAGHVAATIAAQPRAWADWRAGTVSAIGRLIADLAKRSGMDPRAAKAALERHAAITPMEHGP